MPYAARFGRQHDAPGARRVRDVWLSAPFAATEYGEMVRVDLEVESGRGEARQPSKDLVGSLDHGAARLTDEMPVSSCGQMVRGWTVSEMGVDDDAQALQIVENPVDGRHVDLGRDHLDLGTELVGGPVPRRSEQSVEKEDPRAGHPSPLGTQEGQRSLDRIDTGAVRADLGGTPAHSLMIFGECSSEQDAVASWSHSF